MPRPKSPCGTYSAYQRHLREKTPVDAACRRAQQEHDARRAGGWRRRDDDAAPASVALPLSVADQLRAEVEAARVMFGKCVADLAEFH